jgi:hypothetical protein
MAKAQILRKVGANLQGHIYIFKAELTLLSGLNRMRVHNLQYE